MSEPTNSGFDYCAGQRREGELNEHRIKNHDGIRAAALADVASLNALKKKHSAAMEAAALIGVELEKATKTAAASRFELERSLHAMRGRGHNPPGCPECGLT